MGCWAIGGPFFDGDTPVGWGNVDDTESVRAIHRALDLGITLFDTADVYGAGHSERVLGRALGDDRRRVTVATKFGNVFDEQTRRITGQDASPEAIRRACEASLTRLGTDYIDLYQLHINMHPLEQVDEVVAELEKLVAEGRIRAYGWSTDDPERARAFARGEHCATAQFQMNVLSDAPAMVAACEELGLAGLNRGPLAMGLLTGKYTASSKLPENDVRGPRAPEWMSFFANGKPSHEFLSRLASIRAVLESDGRTLAQGALAWLLGRSRVSIPIPGFKTLAQVEENAGVLTAAPLTPAQLHEIAGLMEA
jgi:aryl-alcohol dehydrogenase-like predicted oxidoreductase